MALRGLMDAVATLPLGEGRTGDVENEEATDERDWGRGGFCSCGCCRCCCWFMRAKSWSICFCCWSIVLRSPSSSNPVRFPLMSSSSSSSSSSYSRSSTFFPCERTRQEGRLIDFHGFLLSSLHCDVVEVVKAFTRKRTKKMTSREWYAWQDHGWIFILVRFIFGGRWMNMNDYQ